MQNRPLDIGLEIIPFLYEMGIKKLDILNKSKLYHYSCRLVEMSFVIIVFPNSLSKGTLLFSPFLM